MHKNLEIKTVLWFYTFWKSYRFPASSPSSNLSIVFFEFWRCFFTIFIGSLRPRALFRWTFGRWGGTIFYTIFWKIWVFWIIEEMFLSLPSIHPLMLYCLVGIAVAKLKNHASQSPDNKYKEIFALSPPHLHWHAHKNISLNVT